MSIGRRHLVAFIATLTALGCGGVADQGLSDDGSEAPIDDDASDDDAVEVDAAEGDIAAGGDEANDAGAEESEKAGDPSVCETFTMHACRMRMQYSSASSEIEVTLEVRRVGERRLAVIDGPGTESPWEELVDIEQDGTLETDAGVPVVTCEQIVEQYTNAASWESYEQVEGYPCSEADAALIRFFVVEWFYFG